LSGRAIWRCCHTYSADRRRARGDGRLPYVRIRAR
jgi:hypothetical protein